jgi:hypothetical protein
VWNSRAREKELEWSTNERFTRPISVSIECQTNLTWTQFVDFIIID